MKTQLEEFKSKLKEIQKQFEALKPQAEEIRSYYKYQNDDTRSTSEDFIVNFSNHSGFEDLIDYLDELIEYEEEFDDEEEE